MNRTLNLASLAFMCGASAVAKADPVPLATLLAKAKVAKAVLLCVPGDAEAETPPNSTLGAIANGVGMKVTAFGGVEAVVPKTVRMFRKPIGQPDPFADIPSDQAFKLLVATFDRGQWAALQGAAGIGLGEMRGETQRSLFLCLVSKDDSVLVRKTDDSGETKTVPGEPSSRRLRLARTAHTYVLGRMSKQSIFFGGGDPPPYVLSRPSPFELISLGGLDPYLELPNVPRVLPLDPSAPALTRSVVPAQLQRMRTVEDLTAALREATGLELYVDARYGKRSLFLKATGAASAADLLQGLLLGLGATLRRVGSAYVIVDDAAGIGTRQEAWRQLLEARAAARRTALTQAIPLVQSAFRPDNISPDDSPQKMTEGQREAALRGPNPSALLDMTTTYGQLTSEQQSAVRRGAEWAKKHIGHFSAEIADDTPVRLIEHVNLQILASGFGEPISLSSASFLDDIAQIARRPKYIPPTPKVTNLKDSLARFGERAATFDLAELPSAPERYAALKALGFGAVWVAAPVDDLFDAERQAKLRSALAAIQSAGLAARVVVQPLVRRAGLPEGAYDRTILGEPGTDAGTPKRDAFSWVAPPLHGDLPDAKRIVAALAALPGLRGVVPERTAAPGYMVPVGVLESPTTEDLGYTDEMRLRFLRAHSIDPIDLPMRYPTPREFAFHPPLLTMTDDAVTKAAYEAWARDRSAVDEAAVQAFARDVNAAGKALGWEPVFVRQRRSPFAGTWYGGWTGEEPLLPGSLGFDPKAGRTVEPSLDSFLAREGARAVSQLPPTADRASILLLLDRLAETRKGDVVLDFRDAMRTGLTFGDLLDGLREPRAVN